MKTLFSTRQIHRPTFRRAFLFITALVINVAFTAGPGRATPQVGVMTEFIVNGAVFDDININAKTDLFPLDRRTDFWKAQINTKGVSNLYVVRNTFPPISPTGVISSSGWHTHPGPSLVTVTQGTVAVYDGDDPTCTPRVLSAGSTFIDPTSNNHVHLVRNETGAPAVTVAVQLVPATFGRRNDMPNPNTTGFCSTIN